jgi:hypothetical protein
MGIGDRRSPGEITTTIKNGKGRMPGFPGLANEQLSALIAYLTGAESKELMSSEPTPIAMKYHFTGYHKFLDPDGYPAVAPPWGTLNAINLNTGEYAWKIPLGEYPGWPPADRRIPGRKIMAARSRRRAVWFSSGQRTSIRSSAPSTVLPDGCFGKRPCPLPGTPVQPHTK